IAKKRLKEPSRKFSPTLPRLKGRSSRAVKAQRLAITVAPLGEPGKRGKGRKRVAVSGLSGKASWGTNSATYRVARLWRDHPHIPARLARGEFPSVAAAWRESTHESR